jgi:RNA polymerase sigma-70 factor (ECF subfamily)
VRRGKYLEIASDPSARGDFYDQIDEADDSVIDDDLLRLMFTCCHPLMALEARIALTLRTLGGLTTDEIAKAFLVPEPTLAQRLVRAKKKTRDAGIPPSIPPNDQLRERLAGILAVVYLVFNEGYSASTGDSVVRVGLTSEALRLGRILNELMLEEGEVLGLLALMLLTDSRRDARQSKDGVPEQDRLLWDQEKSGRGWPR